MKRFALIIAIGTVLILTMAGTQLLASNGTINKQQPNPNNQTEVQRPRLAPTGSPASSPVIPLPIVGSAQKLKELLTQAQQLRGSYPNNMINFAQDTRSMKAMAKTEEATNAGADYSTTNVQVAGVDEADVVKTDGKYLYQVNGNRVLILEVYPGDKMKVVNTLKFSQDFNPQELYVDQQHLVVIGNNYYQTSIEKQPVMEKQAQPQVSKNLAKQPQMDTAKKKFATGGIMPEYYPPVHGFSTVKAIIYDIADKTTAKVVRETELEGAYVASRKIGKDLYIVANKYLDYYQIQQQTTDTNPQYRDLVYQKATVSKTTANTINKFTAISYQDIRYFPNSLEANYLMIAGISLDQPEQKIKLSTYLGSGEKVYASPENLYVTVSQYQPVINQPFNSIKAMLPSEVTTGLYKFSLKGAQVEYQGKGEVPGTVINQFSMDEDNGFLRVATTKGEVWRNDEATSQNNVYVLDQALKVVGKLEGIAPGEKIYSARFIGGRAYLVTFKKVDPLFVLDLNNPLQPRILGALKIPGYSDYLHPYDENHIIGFGKDTTEVMQKDWDGKELGTRAYYQGMKLALFDVSDVTHPVEKFKTLIGDRGTDSELLRNHRALLFSKANNLLAFPVTVMEVKNQQPDSSGFPNYGEFSFQGAYVYNIDLAKGFTLRAKLTNLSSQDYLKSGYNWYGSEKNVERILYINDTIYTISQAMVKAFDLKNLQEIGRLGISTK